MAELGSLGVLISHVVYWGWTRSFNRHIHLSFISIVLGIHIALSGLIAARHHGTKESRAPSTSLQTIYKSTIPLTVVASTRLAIVIYVESLFPATDVEVWSRAVVTDAVVSSLHYCCSALTAQIAIFGVSMRRGVFRTATRGA
ncbi:hypothetical protein CC1G_05339 [Coprinopsis cinerea okayama7|uniref:Uncharacterized protein n=1 Tax=Coprinopsis cinerea (strain Okayama-7 / 130 / ATCC MYA-4618 / FGSC 9003) TaxID=240176 RepID=A8NPQ9_COPC7|nr:hypothetical protein CC1G_05339 [Coprinopsis cinerea okayama7\|eukprot:XP_001835377.2 hypothetical protein CC1G_05339 [Coprinopsis cinerea okayama7\